MKKRITCIGAAFVFLIVLAACASDTQPPPSPTPIPSTPTPIPPASTPQPPTPTPAPPAAEPTTAPMAITTFEDIAGTWLRTFQARDFKLKISKDGGASLAVVFNTPLDIWFEDGLFHALLMDFPGCPEGTIVIYEVSGVPGEYLIFELVEDPCVSISGFRGKWIEASAR